MRDVPTAARQVIGAPFAQSVVRLLAISACASLLAASGCRRAAAPAIPALPHIAQSDYDPKIASAIEGAKSRVIAEPQAGAAWGSLGAMLMAHHFHKEAIPCLAQAEKLQANEPRWPYLQGVMLLASDMNAAIPKLERAAELTGNIPPAPRLRLADALLERGQLEQAEKHLQSLAKEHPADAYVLLGWGKLALARERLDEALGHLAKSGANQQTARASLALIAGIMHRVGEADAAAKASSHVAGLPPDPPMTDPFLGEVSGLQTGMQAWLTRAERLFKAEKPREAIAMLEKTVATYPQSAAAWRMLGQAKIRQNDSAAAEQCLRKAAALSPKESATYYHLGTALGSQGRFGEAAESFRKAIELRPNDAAAHFHFGQCSMREGNKEKAIESYRAAIRYDPSFAAAHSRLGDLLAEVGRNDEAIEAWGRAVQLDPADASAAQNLEKAQGRQPSSASASDSK